MMVKVGRIIINYYSRILKPHIYTMLMQLERLENQIYLKSLNRMDEYMEENDLMWLAKWFSLQCNGDWEHCNGISIETLDNPGWRFVIELNDTEYENKPFVNISIERNEVNWIYCSVNEGRFEGVGGVLNLPEIIRVFRDWINN
jgi:hypothetical protein